MACSSFPNRIPSSTTTGFTEWHTDQVQSLDEYSCAFLRFHAHSHIIRNAVVFLHLDFHATATCSRWATGLRFENLIRGL